MSCRRSPGTSRRCPTNCARRSPGTAATRWPSTPSSPSTPASRSTSATPAHPGNAAPTRTPTDCYANTSRNAPASPASAKPTSTRSPPNSTADLDEPSTGCHQPRSSASCCNDRLNPSPLLDALSAQLRDLSPQCPHLCENVSQLDGLRYMLHL